MYRWISGYVRSVYRTIDVRRVSLCAFYGTVPPKHSIWVELALKAARATGSTTIPDVAVFQVLAFWLGDAKTL